MRGAARLPHLSKSDVAKIDAQVRAVLTEIAYRDAVHTPKCRLFGDSLIQRVHGCVKDLCCHWRMLLRSAHEKNRAHFARGSVFNGPLMEKGNRIWNFSILFLP